MKPALEGKFDVHAKITQTIIDSIEAGVPAWYRPWKASHAEGCISRPLRATGEPYCGINTILHSRVEHRKTSIRLASP